MALGLILWVFMASHQYSTISWWHGSAIAGDQPFASSTELRRS